MDNVYCTPECSLLATREFKKNQNLKRKLRKQKLMYLTFRKDITKGIIGFAKFVVRK